MKHNIATLATGIVLVLIGGIALLGNTVLNVQAWRMWPIAVLLAGIGLLVPTLFSIKKPGLAAFFFPGMPVFTTGAILMYASLTNNWGIWAVAWPLEIIAVGLSFVLAAIFMRAPGLAIPASIITINGLMLGFCAVTGMWYAWALMWPIEPLSVGIGLLILAYFNRSSGARQAGFILSIIAGVGFFFASFISVFNETVMRFAVPAMLILTGAIMVGSYYIRTETPASKTPAVSEQQ